MGEVTDQLSITVEKNEKRKFDRNVPSKHGLGGGFDRLQTQVTDDHPHPR
jgi:hypothetical protein